MATTTPIRMQQRADDTAGWELIDPVLLEGELGYDRDENRVKMGDGIHPWSELPFWNLTTDDIEPAIADAITAPGPAQDAIVYLIALRTTISDWDYATLELALADTPNYATLEIHRTWNRTAAFNVNHPCSVRFANGGLIHVTSDSTNGILITSDYVNIIDPNLQGDGLTNLHSNGIHVQGTAADPYDHVAIIGTGAGWAKVKNWSLYGVSADNVTNLIVDGVNIEDCAYAGVMGLAVLGGHITRNKIKRITRPHPTKHATATLNSPSVAAGASEVLTVTVTGASTAGPDPVYAQPPPGFRDTYPGLYVKASVTATDTVTIQLTNTTAAPIDPASGLWTVDVGIILAYGIALTRDSTVSLALSPRSADVLVDDNDVEDVPTWEGLDTHAGDRITFARNRIKRCRQAIVVGPCPNELGVSTYAPLACDVLNNVCQADVQDGSMGNGITFQGAGVSSGGVVTVYEWATGKVQGNTINSYGDDSSSLSAGFIGQYTRGLSVSLNRFKNCSRTAVLWYTYNTNATCTGNTAEDTWTVLGTFAAFMHVNAEFNTIKLAGGNVVTRGTKLPNGTHVNDRGLQVGTSVGNEVIDGNNDFTLAGSPYAGTGLSDGVLRFDWRGILSAYVNAVPVRKVWARGAQAFSVVPTASTSPGWVCVTAGGANSAAWVTATATTAGTWIRSTTGNRVLKRWRSPGTP